MSRPSESSPRNFSHEKAKKNVKNPRAPRLRKQGAEVHQQHRLSVSDEDRSRLGEFAADRFVENQRVVELKAVRAIADEYVAQLLGYLRSGRIETGLLINFSAPVLSVEKYLMSDVLV